MDSKSITVTVDLRLCQSHGECVYVAPEIFQLGDDDILRWEPQVGLDKRAELEDAANSCPMMAIALKG